MGRIMVSPLVFTISSCSHSPQHYESETGVAKTPGKTKEPVAKHTPLGGRNGAADCALHSERRTLALECGYRCVGLLRETASLASRYDELSEKNLRVAR
jgi:hypothetical protein